MQTVEAAEGIFQVTWLLILFPLIGAVILLLGGRRLDRVAPTLGTLASAASFVVAVVLFTAMAGRGDDERALSLHLWDWLAVGSYDVSVGLLLDQLSMAFVLLITGVGSVIHLYSIGYMAEDERKRRFFGYLNLFVAAMLLLVLADDFVILFIGWEGVGLASYLLIGFWQHKDSAATAAKKAFVVNRVGDAGMVLAIMSMFAVFGTTAFAGVFPAAALASEGWLVAIGLLLLLGACGKSAQFPLQSWLLDAMEGPTPVSALIHAATMVTAGVYLVVRAADIYAGAPAAQTAVAIVGAITLLMGAIISCAKDDIKKALAGSTMSQIGYMMLAAGFGPAGYAFAIFHLLTHGFFKANLFLGAGSVMHGMNDEVDMRRYGALRAFMPVTFVTFTAGYLALIGIPPFAGFYSKDPIIETAFGESIGYGAIALLGAGITAFYMTRVMLMTFFGTKRWAAHAAEPHMSSAVADAPAGATAAEPHMSSAGADAPADAPDAHPHESPPVMTTPLWILGTLSLVGGFGLLYLGGGITHWLEPVTGEAHVELPVSVLTIQIITIAVVLAGAGLAWLVFARAEIPATQPAGSFATVAARKDLYGDAFNETVLMRPGQYLTRSLVYAENKGLDAGVGSIAAAIGGLSARVRRVQTGFVRSYALSMLAGAAVVVIAMLVVRLS